MAPSIKSSADLRSPSLPQKRQRTRAAKYGHFIAVNAGQLGMPHYTAAGWPFGCFPADLPQAPVEICTKRRLYCEAQGWPAPPRYHHRHVDKIDKRGITGAYTKRRWERRKMGMMLRTKGWENELDMLEFVELCARLDGQVERERERERERWAGQKDELIPNYEERDGHAALVERAEACWNERLMASLEADGWDLFEDEGEGGDENEDHDQEWVEAACQVRSMDNSEAEENDLEII